MHTLCVSAFSSSSSSSCPPARPSQAMRGGKLKGCAVMMTGRCTRGREMVRSLVYIPTITVTVRWSGRQAGRQEGLSIPDIRSYSRGPAVVLLLNSRAEYHVVHLALLLFIQLMQGEGGEDWEGKWKGIFRIHCNSLQMIYNCRGQFTNCKQNVQYAVVFLCFPTKMQCCLRIVVVVTKQPTGELYGTVFPRWAWKSFVTFEKDGSTIR